MHELAALAQALRALGDPRRHPETAARLLERACLSSLPALPWRRSGYTRNLVWRQECFELLILCWSAGARTPIHDHDGQECWVRPLAGTFDLEDFDEELRLLERRHGVRSLDHRPGQIHRVTAPEAALSLHLYALPVDSCRIFTSQGIIRQPSEYDSAWGHSLGLEGV
jgi:cysteine dioxygenase